MDQSSGVYRFGNLESVIFGAGKLGALGEELSRRGARRALVVTGKSLGASRLLERVTRAAGAALAGVFTGAVQHVPAKTVEALAAEARRVGADSFISFGGGSPIDMAKVAGVRLLKDRPARETVHIAIPTTLSAAEFTAFGGMTDEATRHKGGAGDPRVQPRCVILDPELTAETPAWLWASTGMRALDHAVESSYSTRRQVVTDALCARAIAMLTEHLRPSLATVGAEQIEHRMQCQLAAWLSIFGMTNTRAGISHALGHQIGPYWNVPHGYTSCITLPHVMRFMANVAPERFGAIATGFGVRFDAASPRAAALECADRAAQFIAQFEVPTRLRDVGVARAELGAIAAAVLAEVAASNVVGREVTEHDLVALLEAAY
ncbi:MAG TPA: iron-containing alcohol dehydrogenase [Candidatus Binataceae bacterium]|nr:iron-containing alcohol dehydrogenase [Candidatus Binataceae bacterium]